MPTMVATLTRNQKTVLRAFNPGSIYLEDGNKVDLDFLGYNDPALAHAASQLSQLGIINYDTHSNEYSLTKNGLRLLKVMNKGG